ncbi:MAG TPA: helix-turn-helix domain-containing protein [Anaeromyxobacteraceae bacterium]|nr:helix-turn-helix domain-containing protein [Anaeromyxobacteraceae bacterium]
MKTAQAKAKEAEAQKEALVREMLDRVGDKWTLLVIEELGSGGEMRFTRLRDRIGNVSQKMLTKTLRQLERDGLVSRRVHPVVPPRVDYKLTGLGEALGEAVCGIWTWVEKHLDDVQRSRQAYDGRRAGPPERVAADA